MNGRHIQDHPDRVSSVMLFRETGMDWCRRSVLMLVATAPLSPLPASAAALVPIRFLVEREGQPIGTHDLVFTQAGDTTEVQVAIALEVKLLGFTVYRYLHDSRELWRDGMLTSVATRTDDDGLMLQMQAHRMRDVLVVDGQDGRVEISADTIPTSYWDRRIVARTSWLDTQAGKVLHGRVTGPVADRVDTASGPVQAERYELQGDLALTLWYAGPDWVGLRFIAPDGSTITYRRTSPLEAGS